MNHVPCLPAKTFAPHRFLRGCWVEVQRDEWGCAGDRDRRGVLLGAVPAAPLWRLQEAAAHGLVRHAAGLVPVLSHRLYSTPGRQHGQSSLSHQRKFICHQSVNNSIFFLLLSRFPRQTIYKQCKIDHEEHITVPTVSPGPAQNTTVNTSVTPTKR